MTLTRMLVTLQIAFGDLRDRVRNQDSDRGATAVEYGLMVALIAGAIILTVTLLGTKLDGLFSSVSGALP
jgi:pilus assembly protein Flp/PilA